MMFYFDSVYAMCEVDYHDNNIILLWKSYSTYVVMMTCGSCMFFLPCIMILHDVLFLMMHAIIFYFIMIQ
jgi:hypothetical protein